MLCLLPLSRSRPVLGNDRPRVSLVLTVKNEAATLPALLASIADQTVPPDEVVIVDGGSTDDTLAILERWRDRLPLVIDVFPGASISQGRNRALALARGDIVAVTDGGVVLAPDWLERLVAPFTAPPAEQP
ncbi:MAG: glycosyltransferase family 2 protein, partial [Thermorudis peleae]|nr:glycosyltransferase family 2 protein [Thermorudis peleae]